MSSDPVEILAPAPPWVLGHIADDRGLPLMAGARLRGGVMRQYFKSDRTAALVRGPELIAVAGRYRVAGDDWIWFCAGPGLTGNLLAAVRAVPEVMRGFVRGSDPLLASVRTDLAMPPKVARLAGFDPTRQSGQIGPIFYEVYRWDRKRQKKIQRPKLPQKSSVTAPMSKPSKRRRTALMSKSA